MCGVFTHVEKGDSGKPGEGEISLLLFQAMLYQVCVVWREKHKTPSRPLHLGVPLPCLLQIVSHIRWRRWRRRKRSPLTCSPQTGLRRWKLYHLAISLGNWRLLLLPEAMECSGTTGRPQPQWEPGRAGLSSGFWPYSYAFALALGQAPVMGRVWTCQPSP